MIRFERLEGDPGVRIVDPVERRQFDLRTADAVSPVETDPGEFRFPVDGAVTVETVGLSIPVVAGFVRDGANDRVATLEPGTETSFPRGSYSVELNAPVKVYVRVSGPIVADVDPERLDLSFDGPREVRIGARSYHERPAGTIIVPDDPGGLLEAMPALASSLKTTSCERSFPTLRGHPPLLSVGDRLSIPDGLEPPDAGITLELPADYGTLLVAAPLAYYLGADVRPASEPRLVTDHGFEHDLDGQDGFERTVRRTLERVFLMDCVTRTEGLYPVDLAERTALESVTDLDFAALYERPPARQLATYLSVPYERVSEHVPTWALTAHLPAAASSTAVLPYVLDDLGVVRTATARRLTSAGVRSRVLEQYADPTSNGGSPGRSSDVSTDGDEGPDNGGAAPEPVDATPDNSHTSLDRGETTLDQDDVRSDHDDARRGDDARRDDDFRPENGSGPSDAVGFVDPRTAGSMEDAWFGEGIPLDATRATHSAFQNRLADGSREGPTDVAVVCSDPEMLDERDAVRRTYGARSDLPFAVSFHEALTTGALGELLATDLDFLHYVGHVDERGFECRDGYLDAADLPSVGVRAFLLNACESYRQGLALIDGGSVGGVVTHDDVVDDGAFTIGRTVARLLDLGFPLRAALGIARSESVVGGHYIVVGDGSVDVAQDGTGIPIICDATAIDGGSATEDAVALRSTGVSPTPSTAGGESDGRRARDAYAVSVTAYLPSEGGMGSIAYPIVTDPDQHFLAPGELDTFVVEADDLRAALEREWCPIRIDGSLLLPGDEGQDALRPAPDPDEGYGP